MTGGRDRHLERHRLQGAPGAPGHRSRRGRPPRPSDGPRPPPVCQRPSRVRPSPSVSTGGGAFGFSGKETPMSPQAEVKNVTVPWVAAARERAEPLVMVTAYDCPQGRTADAAGADIVLVGDSLAMVVLGYPDTLSVTMEEMLHHVRAVRRGVKRALLVADMPYGSFHLGIEPAVGNAVRFVKEAGAQAVKIE